LIGKDVVDIGTIEEAAGGSLQLLARL